MTSNKSFARVFEKEVATEELADVIDGALITLAKVIAALGWIETLPKEANEFLIESPKLTDLYLCERLKPRPRIRV